jgi:hypothetical protein
MALQLRRGNTAERLLIVPKIGELIYDTQLKQLFTGDGTTAGGNTTTGSGITGATTLNELTDVTLTTQLNGQVLAYDGTSWSNTTVILALDGLSDVAIANPVIDQVLAYDGTSWSNRIMANLATVGNDPTPILGGNLDLNLHSITGTGSISILGNITAGASQLDSTITVSNQTGPALELSNISGPNSAFIDLFTANTSLAAPTPIINNDVLGGIVFQTYNGTSFNPSIGIRGAADGNVINNQVPGRLNFLTMNATGSAHNVMSFDSNGILAAPIIQVGAYTTLPDTRPLSASPGQIIFETTSSTFQGWNGTAWATLG